ncbi:hypothetical protein BJY00DRAFT_324796 [Aspergillus carlsbadensis]|nr:hypothetical protein BJY00DRAFT_324796 [Aspergillus carlsbadensis]
MLVLPYAYLLFFVKYLDVSPPTIAYVSGMREDLDLTRNRLNYINAAYEVGYVVFQISSNLALVKYPTAFVITYKQLVVMRFFVGPGTTSCYLGLVHVVNSQALIEWWYRKKELGCWNVVFWFANSLGQMISKQQRSFIFRSMPERTKSWFLSRSEQSVAPRPTSTYLFFLLVIFSQQIHGQGNPLHLLSRLATSRILRRFRKQLEHGHSSSLIAGALIRYFWSDIRKSNIEQIVLSGILLKFFTYITIGCACGFIPALVAWTAEVLAGNLEVRTIPLASYDMFSEIAGVALPLVARHLGKAPGFRGRFSWAPGLSVVYLGIVTFIVVLSGKEAKREEKVGG